MRIRTIAVIAGILGVLSLSACGGSPEQSSRGAESPLELAKIQQEAIAENDWETVCAYTEAELATEVQLYWLDSSDTCAGNAESVINYEYRSPSRAIEAAAGEFDWSTAVVTADEDDPDRARVEVDYRDGGESDSLTVRAEHVEGIGWQSRSSF